MSVPLIYSCTIQQLLCMVHGMGFIAQKIPLILYGFPLNYVCCTLYRKKPKLVQDFDTVNAVSARSFFFLEQFREGTCIEEPLNSPPFEFMSAPTPFGDVLSWSQTLASYQGSFWWSLVTFRGWSCLLPLCHDSFDFQ